MRAYQRGATLIVVLVLLLVVTILGTMAVRQSITSLNIATNSQAQALLLQSSDTAFFNIEDAKALASHLLTNGLFGFVKTDNNKGKELVFCYRPRQHARFFNLQDASLIYYDSNGRINNSSFGTSGYCSVTANDFGSQRSAVITQIAVKVADSTSQPFQFMQEGTDTETAKIDQQERIVVYSTSVVPGLTQDIEEINNCFKNYTNEAQPQEIEVDDGVDEEGNPKTKNETINVSVASCLADINAPYSSQVAEYNLMQLVGKTQVAKTTTAGS